MKEALAQTRLSGIETNLHYLKRILNDPTFAAGEMTTQFLGRFDYPADAIDVFKPGTQTTVQDYPGRLHYWAIGVPPSGPVDPLAFRLANRLLNNPEHAAALELTVSGPTLRFNEPATIAITGADMRPTLDGQSLPLWTPIQIPAGATLDFKSVNGPGCRTYVAFENGLDVPPYLGSRSTFTLGKFGGHGGRALRAGDVLRVNSSFIIQNSAFSPLPPTAIPTYSTTWVIHVLYGPHGAPDFFTQEDIDTLFSHPYKVHHHSDRTGVRLIGPHPKWARTDGGEAGLHPSNIHDNAYAVGTIDFTGNLPIILGPDGPSLGGFVCPATIIQADLWKIGQLKPGDTIHFRAVTQEQARELEDQQERLIETLQPAPNANFHHSSFRIQHSSLSPILHRIPATPTQIAVTYRQDGDKYLLVEYGPLVLDLNLRFRVHALMTHLEANPLPGIIDLTPGIRSLHVHYDSRILPLSKLMDALTSAESQLPDVEHTEVPTRIVHLPLSWDDPACQLAIQKYMQVVRKDAPWCPSNLEFIRRINGLSSIADVHRIVFDASYLVLGLGDVYLGAPVATPVDPRHRLVTTKYNPARTWTAENSVGIGGAYLCVYGMEGPGGYQFVGRTCQMWNPWRQTSDFTGGKPWLLRFFDQIRFYPVTASELLKFREDFPTGRVKLKIEHQTFRLKDYNKFLADNAHSIASFKKSQQTAFNAERDRWEAAGLNNFSSDPPALEADSANPTTVAPGAEPVFAEVPGNVWKIPVQPGQRVRAGQTLAILESMKTEIPVPSPADGTVADIFCSEGRFASPGQLLFAITP